MKCNKNKCDNYNNNCIASTPMHNNILFIILFNMLSATLNAQAL